MRTTKEIQAEISKVSKAKEAAIKKVERCEKRLAELDKELQEAKLCQPK